MVRQGAGFYAGGPTVCDIPDTSGNRNPPPCMYGCGDPDCVEWADVWPLDLRHAPTLYHVAECEMDDLTDGKGTAA